MLDKLTDIQVKFGTWLRDLHSILRYWLCIVICILMVVIPCTLAYYVYSISTWYLVPLAMHCILDFAVIRYPLFAVMMTDLEKVDNII